LYEWGLEIVTLSNGMGVIRSGATLIIAPATLLGQWERELRDKHVAGSQLKILKISRASDAKWQSFEPHMYTDGVFMQESTEFNRSADFLVRARISLDSFKIDYSLRHL
jgi:SNF2 family DNA or RNA helicase